MIGGYLRPEKETAPFMFIGLSMNGAALFQALRA
jgi:hypothetical protein